jgi:uncharacterized protein DUF3987/uncharacterized protein DUF3854
MSKSGGPRLLQLLPQHRADLRKSGLDDKTIEAWGVYSVEPDQKWVMSQLGFPHVDPPVLALPVLSPDRIKPNLNDVILKPDRPRTFNGTHSIKYEARPKSRNRLHVPLSIRDKIIDVAVPLVITEGQKKAEKAGQEGICAVALAGVWNWKDRVGDVSFPISDFELIPLTDRQIILCFDSDAVLNPNVRKAECDLAKFLTRRYGERVSIKRLPQEHGDVKIGPDDFLLTHTAREFWALPEQHPKLSENARSLMLEPEDWPDPSTLGEDLRPVDEFSLELLPPSFRLLVEDVSERMQTPLDYAAAAAIVALAGCVNRRAVMRPRADDQTWVVVPNLWGAIVGPPGYMKSPVLRAITLPLTKIEEVWRVEHSDALTDYEAEKEQAELRHQAWREETKRAFKKNQLAPPEPDKSIRAPRQKRLVLTDATFEKLHEILSENPAGILVIRDELTGWLGQLDRHGREGERGFFLQAWSGDTGFTVDRIGRGSIHVPAVCVSLLGNIQPSRLRCYLSEVTDGGRNDDGLFQRFQVLVWPDLQRSWHLVDREPNSAALAGAEIVYSRLASLSEDDPVRMRFSPEAQKLFNDWLTELEGKIRNRSDESEQFVAHLAKYRSLMPTLAALFELADRAAAGDNFSDEIEVNLSHTRQAAAFCDYLEDHARRVYACVVTPEFHAARSLAQHIRVKDVGEIFSTRSIYLKGWSGLGTADRVRAALHLLKDAGWIRRLETTPSASGGRASEDWIVNPKVTRNEK